MVTIYNSLGMAVGSVLSSTNVTQQISPGGMVNTAMVMLDFKVSDPKTNAMMFVYNEDRSRKGGRGLLKR
jgi:hypothetical protein